MVTFLFFLGRMNRFVFVTDGLLNSFCIVFSFKMSYVTIPCLNCSKKYIQQNHQQSPTQTHCEKDKCEELQTEITLAEMK